MYRKNVNNITTRQRRRRIAAELLQVENEVKSTDSRTKHLIPKSDSISFNVTPENVHNFNSSSIIASNILDYSYSNSVLSNTSNLNMEVNAPQNQNINASSIHVIHHKKDQAISFKDFLRSWAIQENINASSLNKLLRGFSNYGLNVTYSLPLDSRTLLNTPRSTEIRRVEPGFYSNLGIEQGILEYIKNNPNIANNTIEMLFNIDGLPVTKSGSSELWPILGLIYKTNHVFLIGLYHGNKKPCDTFAFLENFVVETSNLTHSGITYLGKTYSFSIKGFCADAPTKAMVLNIKYHTGYSSCTECNIVGDYSERRVCFTEYIGRKRSDKSFVDHEDEDYHQGTSPLENIPRLGLVSQVPLDYQHLVCLGIVKKLLLMWNFGDLRVRIPFRNVQLISSALYIWLEIMFQQNFNESQDL